MTKEKRDELIISQYEKGYKQSVIAAFYDLDQSTVSKIISSKKRGLPYQPKKRGVKPKLLESQLEDLKTYLKKQPSEYGIDRGMWDKWSVKALIKQKFDVDYHENYIWKIMDKIGFTPQIPQVKDYRKDGAAVEKFKREKAPELKKKRGRRKGNYYSKTKPQFD